jgi:hypothetical protein
MQSTNAAYGFVDDAFGTGLLSRYAPSTVDNAWWTDFAAHRVAHRNSPSSTSSTGNATNLR